MTRINPVPSLIQTAASGALLVFAGAAACVAAPSNTWLTVVGLLGNLTGIALLYRATHLWMNWPGRRARFAQRSTSALRPGIGPAIIRVALIIAMAAATLVWLWNAAVETNELRLLVFEGKTARAQIIGHDIVPKSAPVGYVHYAFRVSPTLAIEDRFAVPHRSYADYTVGQSFLVTYATAAPHIHRVGGVAGLLLAQRICYWLLLLAIALAYLYFPLWFMEFRRPAAGSAN